MDLSIFTTPEAWISLITLIFLEIILGVDNLVFISITTNRLPEEKQHIGRKLGLAGALVMRIIFLCFASYLVHMTTPLFTLDLGAYSHGFSVRDLVLLIGGVYLIYKGIAELRDMLKLTEIKAEHCEEHKALHMITLPQAVGTIMVMDLVFSIDSVITAVGMADHLIIMIIAVMLAVFMMMIFIDPISNFINGHPEMKMLALTFIIAIGGLLVIDSAGFHTGIELLHMPLEKLIVYFAMVFCIVLELIQMRYNKNFLSWRKDRWKNETAAQIETVRAEMEGRIAEERAAAEAAAKSGIAGGAQKEPARDRIQPVIIGNNVYVMMPMAGEDAASFKELMATSSDANAAFGAPLEIPAEAVEVEDVVGEDESADADDKTRGE
ncbi:TerC family protein [Raoultibacter phocaeensis]|uniref:TerC family protein n=1 Tax=Raoultibacter phocaeensis TaxID=2479841 RepID=UPI001118881C|nr:TerC family protein [Raoultibacter phocaeensis]